MAGQGQQHRTKEELNDALYDACGRDNDQARAEELLGRGADQHALVYGDCNALHLAALCGREQIVAMLRRRGAVLEARTRYRETALLLAALHDKPEVCLLLIAKGADLRVRDKYNQSALSHYGLSCRTLSLAWIKDTLFVNAMAENLLVLRSCKCPQTWR